MLEVFTDHFPLGGAAMTRLTGSTPVSPAGPRTAPVVVELGDGRAASLVSWAAGWAASERCPLVVLAAHPVSHGHPIVRRRLRRLTQVRAEQVLPEVRRRHPDLELRLETAWDDSEGALLAAAEEARAVVLRRGSEGERQPAAFLRRTAARAPCPVVVVPAEADAPETGPGTVVVGVDDSPEAWEAVEYAAQAAARRGWCLTVLHAWDVPGLELALGRRQPDVALEPGETAARGPLEPLLERLRQDHPSLPVTLDLVRGEAAPTLRERARGAALLVVGSRGRGGVAGLLLGSVSRDLILTSPVPLVVARTARVDTEPEVRSSAHTRSSRDHATV
jgi:nucleotide-binding universal stress UspA family protein